MNWLPAFGIALTVTAPNKEDPKKSETPSIVGEWQCTKLVGGGQEFPDPKEVAQLGFEFTADGKCRCHFGNDLEGPYTTDMTKDPAVLEFKDSKTEKKRQMIYKVEKDTLTICLAEGNAERPTKFESPAGTSIMLMTFRRVEKKKD